MGRVGPLAESAVTSAQSTPRCGGVAVVAAIAPLSLLSGEAHAEVPRVSNRGVRGDRAEAKRHPRLRRPRRLRKHQASGNAAAEPEPHARLQR